MTSKIAESIQTSQTLALAAKARNLSALGKNIIDLGVGELDLPTPDFILDSVRENISLPTNHKYSDVAGLRKLREMIAAKATVRHEFTFSENNVLVTNGAKQALFNTLIALLNSGDEVLIPSPFWTSYPELVKIAHGQPKIIPTEYDNQYKLTATELKKAITEKSKVLILCSPSNPTGSVLTDAELNEICNLAFKHGLWIVFDEIYADFYYRNETSAPGMKSINKDLLSKIVIVNGFSKTFSMTGWRLGWAVAPFPIISTMTKLQSHISGNVSNISQIAGIAALSNEQPWITYLKTRYSTKASFTYEMLNSYQDITVLPSDGAFYSFPKIDNLIGRSFESYSINNGFDLAEFLIEYAGIVTIPGNSFGNPNNIRISFATSDENLEQGLTKLISTLKLLQ